MICGAVAVLVITVALVCCFCNRSQKKSEETRLDFRDLHCSMQEADPALMIWAEMHQLFIAKHLTPLKSPCKANVGRAVSSNLHRMSVRSDRDVVVSHDVQRRSGEYLVCER